MALDFCRISLAAEWYCNLNSHPHASIPYPPEDTMATHWHKRNLSDFSLELGIEQLPVIKDESQGCLSGNGLITFHLKDSDNRGKN